MSVDYTKLQLLSSSSSNKVLLQGSGTFTIAALGGIGAALGQATIPHGFTSDRLLWQVATFTNVTAEYVILPWESNDTRLNQFTNLDDTNLYIFGVSSDSSGLGAPAYTISYYYRLLVP